MAHPNNTAYQQFSKLYIEANPGENKTKQELTSEAMSFWKTNIKKSPKDPIDKNVLDLQMIKLRDKIEDRKRKRSIQYCFF